LAARNPSFRYSKVHVAGRAIYSSGQLLRVLGKESTRRKDPKLGLYYRWRSERLDECPIVRLDVPRLELSLPILGGRK
jgi:hypothetical protein